MVTRSVVHLGVGPSGLAGLKVAGLRGGIPLGGFSSDTVDLGRASLYGTLLDGYPSGMVGVWRWNRSGTLLGGRAFGRVGDKSFRSATVLLCVGGLVVGWSWSWLKIGWCRSDVVQRGL